MLLTLIVPLLVLASVPPVQDRFPAVGASHVFLVVDRASGRLVRADDAEACETTRFPAGEAIRPIVALAGLERALDPEDSVDCDSTCWGQGRHGSPTLLDALAVSCDPWFREAEASVSRLSLEEQAADAGFAVQSGQRPGRWGMTARGWVELWSALSNGALGRRPVSAATLLAGAGLAVSSPRGTAHTLHHPTARARAFAGASEEGAWVSGTFRADERHSWIFALFVRGGTTPLAVARASALLDETLRIFRTSTDERGGAPLPPLEER